MVASPSSSTQSANRRPSELNAAADLVGLGGSKADEEAAQGETEDTSGADSSKKKESKGSSEPSDKKTEGPSDAGDKAVDKNSGSGGDSDEGKSEVATTDKATTDKATTDTDGKGQVTALSVIKDQMASAAANGTTISTLPLPEEDGPLKKKTKIAGGKKEDDQMIVDENGEKTSFPLLLHNVVTDPATDDCIHWLSCGTRFIISDKKKFARDVLPRFYGPAKFTSFTRRLKRWSFARVPSGPFMGAYYNPNFRRGEPELAHRVRYNHPSPLSGAGLVMQQQKLAAVKGNMMPMNMNLAGMSETERAELFRQMNGGMNPMMSMNMGMMGYGMMMGGGPMMNQNMMMMGGGGGGMGYGKEEGKNAPGNDASGRGGGEPPAGGNGTNPSTLAMLMEQERQRIAFQQQMGGAGGSEGSNKGSNQEPMNGTNSPGGGSGGGGNGTNASFSNLLSGGQGGSAQSPAGYGPGGQGNLNAILAQYATQGGQGGGSRGADQGKADEADKEDEV
eukprot:CAMPEP_0201697148 /NCGR_PEP_ID=MMETSP0578-20130828/9629_1 /ASSEMBLY_ACC=CAM_ASM_000663 /TAXON_ID=267565 /ORGANISM="Skeletonema grethea, Strain CCMP 1804" /LENGTH=504 /DNA_ID=CAMNT_0048183233 /DNA_START=111 /DNA_END=1625 /DNA_ORIENTATION=+